MIFVFGSNLKGIHGAGAAKFAKLFRGAREGNGYGFSMGPRGWSYAIPTCSEPRKPLSLKEIQKHINIFLEYARKIEQDDKNLHVQEPRQFQVTRIGCGLAGYKDEQIAPMFIDAPDNVWLPAAWFRWLAWKADL